MHDDKQNKMPYTLVNYLKKVSPTFILASLEWFCCHFVRDDSVEEIVDNSTTNEFSAFDEDAI